MAQVWIDDVRCTGCGDCLRVCPVSAIALVGDKAQVDVGRCSGCGACLAVCSAGAIHEVLDVDMLPAHTQLSSSPSPTPSMAPTSADTHLASTPFVRPTEPLAQVVTATVTTAAASLAMYALQGALQVLGRWLSGSQPPVIDGLSQGPRSVVRRGGQVRDTSAGRGRRARNRARVGGRR